MSQPPCSPMRLSWGGASGGGDGGGRAATRTSLQAHQLAGVESCSASPYPLSQSSVRSGWVGPIRQYDSSSIHQPAGGTHSPSWCYLLWDVLMWCQRHRIHLKALHVQGTQNTVADALSRGRLQFLESALKQSAVNQICLLWDTPHIDLFASRGNRKFPVYASLRPEQEAEFCDALHIS